MRRHVIRKSLGVSMSPLSRLSLINYLFTVFRRTVMQSKIKLQQLKKGIYAHGYWSPQVKGLSRSYPKIGTDPQDNDYDDEWVSISQLICTVYWTNMIMKQASIKKKTSVPWSYGKTYSQNLPLVSKHCCKKEKKRNVVFRIFTLPLHLLIFKHQLTVRNFSPYVKIWFFFFGCSCVVYPSLNIVDSR